VFSIVASPALSDELLFFLRGDSNGDGTRDIADAVSTLMFLFAGGVVTCLDAADADDSGVVDVADAVAVLRHLFLGEGHLPPPFRECGLDPPGDPLDCQGQRPCGG
jgi:hypothetical protein